MYLDRKPEATITGPHRFPRWYASYTVGIGIVEAGSFAFTRKGIERKAQRVIRKLEHRERIYESATTITSDAPLPTP